MSLVVGVDAGGTQTRAAVALNGIEIARSDGAGGAMRRGAHFASGIIAEVVRRALAGVGTRTAKVLAVGAAGAGRPAERDQLRQALRNEGIAATVIVTTDVAIALEAAFPERPGIVLIAGTGSIALARDAQGQERRVGGWGWQMGDEGSGYAIGRAVLMHVGRAADGREPPSELRDSVLAIARAEDMDALVRWAQDASPAEVASLARAVLAGDAAGDPRAQAILEQAAAELAAHVSVLAPTLGIVPAPVALAGGLLATDSPLRTRVTRRLEALPGIRVEATVIDAVVGALLLAQRAA